MLSLICATLVGYLTPEPQPEFLIRNGDQLVSTHAVELRLDAPGLRLVSPAHRSARFNDVPFDISLSAFLGDETAIMVHAEQVADGSGAANYSRFPETDWPIGGFRDRPPQCLMVTEDIARNEHDIAWLASAGFDPVGAVWIDQYFITDPSYNDEVVISLMIKAQTCDGDAPDVSHLKSQLSVRMHHNSP